MVQLRMMGPTNELKRMKRVIERNRCLDVISISEVFSNKGTTKYFRQYGLFHVLPYERDLEMLDIIYHAIDKLSNMSNAEFKELNLAPVEE